MRKLPQQSSDRNEVVIYPPEPNCGQPPRPNNLNYFNKKILLIVGLGLLVLIGAIVCLVLLLNRKKKEIEESEGFLINNGYFYPSDDKSKLYKCSTINCQKCQGTINENYCYQCFTNSTPTYYNSIIIDCIPNQFTDTATKPTSQEIKPEATIPPDLCIQGSNEKCLECNESKDKCLTCNPGYFIPEDSESQYECQKCPVKNCKQCIGSSNSTKCLSCEKYSVPDDETNIKECLVQLGSGPLCKNIDSIKNECTNCNDGYLYLEGKCILNYDIKAVFKTRIKNENIKLIQKFYQYIEEMTVNGIKLNRPVKTYTFTDKGEHVVYYKIRMPENGSLNGMFEGLNKVISISFSENMEFENITQMNRMFYNCQNLQSIDLSHLNTKNVDIMNYMFYQCLSIDNIDLSEVESSNVKDISNMFENCVSVKNIDISNLTNDKIQITDMFKGIPDTGNIVVNENLKDKINKLIPNWNIVTK